MGTLIEPGIVRILTATKEIVGAGFLAGSRRLLTCAHVVAGALGTSDVAEVPQAEVLLDFPFLSPGHILYARVVRWLWETDFSGLELLTAPPTIARPVPLVIASDLWGHRFRIFGFPPKHNDGVWASGVLRGQTASNWVQIEDIKETGFRVGFGFSGAPVWDEEVSGVVGMAAAAESSPEVRAAFMIPTLSLLRAWPQLEQSLQVPGPGFRKFVARGEKTGDTVAQGTPAARWTDNEWTDLQNRVAQLVHELNQRLIKAGYGRMADYQMDCREVLVRVEGLKQHVFRISLQEFGQAASEDIVNSILSSIGVVGDR